MFDRIFDFLADVWEWLIPWVIIDQYERGVVLRFGKFNREIGPGLRIIWPFGIEEVKYETVVRQTSYLDPQSLITADGKTVTVSGIIVFTIADIKRFILEIDDGETDMNNICYGIISDCIETSNLSDITGFKFCNEVFNMVKDECDEYCGVNVLAVKWSDKAPARNIRLWND